MAKWKKGDPSPNPAGRPKGRTDEIMSAIRKQFGSEPDFWVHIAKAAKEGDSNCLNLLTSRVRPPYKPRAVTVQLDIDGNTAADFTSGVLRAVSGGELPPDEASSLLNAILAGDKLEKLEALEQKVDRLLEAHAQS